MPEFTHIHGSVKYCSKPMSPPQPKEDKKKGGDKKGGEKKKGGKGGDKKGGDKGGKGKDKGGKGNKGNDEEEKEEKPSEYSDPIYEKYYGVLKNAKQGKVVTRFPPEPSGFVHVGHMKAATLNYHYAKMYGGKMILRFDDTNPANEKDIFVQNIKDDLATMDINPDIVTYSSNYFGQLEERMDELILKGGAYCDPTPMEEMKRQRYNREENDFRNTDAKTNKQIWDKLKQGKDTHYAVRAKIDIKSNNGCLRDPVMYRYMEQKHHRTKDKFNVYPTYDFACPQIDNWEGITHCLRTTEYRDRDDLYKWVLKQFKLPQIQIFEYAKLQFKSSLMSKRKLRWFVETGNVDDWDDARFPTVQGLLRRGVTVQNIKEFMLEQGPSQNNTLMEWDKFWSNNTKIVDLKSARFMGISKESHCKVRVTNAPAFEGKSVQKHPKDNEMGTKSRMYTRDIFCESADFLDKKVGDKITIKSWGNAFIDKIIREFGENYYEVSLALEDTNYKGTTKVTWVTGNSDLNTSATILEFGHLITKDKLEEDDDVAAFVNPNSRQETQFYVEKDMGALEKGDTIQIERRGFFIVDSNAQSEKGLVLHFIPDGKSGNMSSLESKIKAKDIAKGTGGGGDIKKKEEAPEGGEQKLSKKQLKKLQKKQEKKNKKASNKEEQVDTTT